MSTFIEMWAVVLEEEILVHSHVSSLYIYMSLVIPLDTGKAPDLIGITYLSPNNALLKKGVQIASGGEKYMVRVFDDN